ncbi:MAG: hypothetical protein HYZ16_03080 [Bacteroidetes bacterium]|jgi:hypothetical protein|nr:hypothetical protein [Bacteroidota bacterium]
MPPSKPRIIKDFEKLTDELQQAIKDAYPQGFFKYMVDYLDREGKKKSALPFETPEYLYLVRMPSAPPKGDEDDDDLFWGDDQPKKRRKGGDDEEGFADMDEMEEDDEPRESMDDRFDEI